MHNDVTAHLGLPKPHPDNLLEQDVTRLRDGFDQLDTKLQQVLQILQSDDLNLDTVQEIIAAVKDAQGDMTALQAVVNAQINTLSQSITDQLAATEANVAAQLAASEILIYGSALL